MARPQKTGLDYFSHDVDASNDEKIESMEALYGASGYCFYFKLLERIYRAGGELIVSDAETRQILAKKCLCTTEEWLKMLASALKIGLFDSKIYNISSVLTSLGISERCKLVFKKREKMANKYQNRVSDAETPPETRQKPNKVKESKGKESKEEKRKEKRSALTRFVPPTESEVSAYCLERGNSINPALFISSNQSKGWVIGKSPMKDWKATIRTWEQREKANGKQSKLSTGHESATQRAARKFQEQFEYFPPSFGASGNTEILPLLSQGDS